MRPSKPSESEVRSWNELTKQPTRVGEGVPPEIVVRMEKELRSCHILNIDRRGQWTGNGIEIVEVFYSYATPPGSGGFESVIHYASWFVRRPDGSWVDARQFLPPAGLYSSEKPAVSLDFLEKAADEVLPSGIIKSPKGKRPKFQ